MRWLERTGYVLAIGLLGLFAYSFYWPTDDWITAEEATLEAAPVKGATLVAEDELLIEARLVENGQEVLAGQPLIRYHEGEAARRYRAMAQVRETFSAASEVDKQAALNTLQVLLGRQTAPKVYAAKAAGVVRFASADRSWIEPNEKVLDVLDYTHLVLTGTLSGKSISRAKVGQEAEISNIKIGSSDDPTVLGEAGSETFISRNLLSPDFVKSIQTLLQGKIVRARDDVPLVVEEVEAIEVETRFEANAPIPPGDPLPGFTLKGQVLGGQHTLIGQLAMLPEALRKQVETEFASELKRNGMQAVGSPHLLFKLKAGDGEVAGVPLDVASLKRTYDATISIVDAPADLVNRLKQMNRLGKQASARVRVRTGTRSLASMLLRRS
jgi:hypothetical protein